MMTSRPEDLAARAAAAALAGTHQIPNADGPHPTLDEVSDATFGLPDDARAAEILDHAEACDACAVHVTELESVVELAQFAYPDPMPAAVDRQLMAALAAEAVGRTHHSLPSDEAPNVAATPVDLADLPD
jgi:hypothetical protein